MRQIVLFWTVLAFATGLALAQATPPALMNYQGVLRNALDQPLSGTYDMVFRFYNEDVAGNEILVDSHTIGSGGQVTASGGLFNVNLGSGAVSDGSGPETYTSLAEVFRDYGTVWLSIQVGSETLSPRMRIVPTAYALNAANATNLNGQAGSNYLDTSTSSQTKSGTLTLDVSVDESGMGTRGIVARGTLTGGYFEDIDGTGHAWVGTDDRGIYAQGEVGGGDFLQVVENQIVAHGRVAMSETGIWASGNRGVEGFGTEFGGYFRDYDQTGTAFVGFADRGIEAYGAGMGGYFKASANSGYAHVGVGDRGIFASGTDSGGLFMDGNSSGYAYVGVGDRGITAIGSEMGGYFADADSTGVAWVGHREYGIYAVGSYGGGWFVDTDDGAWAKVGSNTSKIAGNGASTSFVQNHPLDEERVIVYSALEGDEVGVYTRGTARLRNGEATVDLGPTFRHVTNPDLGLTVYVSSIGTWSGLYVEQKGTDQIIVRSTGGDLNAVFDYIVYGLRIGFEESSIVQEKEIESYIPSMKTHRELFGRRPELRAFSAMERFRAMQGTNALPAIDLSRANALKSEIHEYDPATDPPACKLLGLGPCAEKIVNPPSDPGTLPAAVERAPGRLAGDEAAQGVGQGHSVASVIAGRARPDTTSNEMARVANLFAVSERVEIGDLLTLDAVQPGQLQKSGTSADKNVVGIVVAEPIMMEGQLKAALAESHFAVVKADASYGKIMPGDFLVSSETPGHAMRAPQIPAAGTVIGKALDSLETGTALIKVLVMPR
jgi:hypothetical protein